MISVESSGFKVPGFRVQSSEFRVQGLGFRVGGRGFGGKGLVPRV